VCNIPRRRARRPSSKSYSTRFVLVLPRQACCRVGKSPIADFIERHVVVSPWVPVHRAARVAFPVAFGPGCLGTKELLNLLLDIGTRRSSRWVWCYKIWVGSISSGPRANPFRSHDSSISTNSMGVLASAAFDRNVGAWNENTIICIGPAALFKCAVYPTPRRGDTRSRPELCCSTTGGSLPPHLAPTL